jgi:hypothetical protein
MRKFFVIYWETLQEKGFVSYDNPTGMYHSEYVPCDYANASIYKDRKSAEKTKNWYAGRNLGFFKIMEVKEK